MTGNKKSNRFVGRLTPAQIAQGMNCANSNAKRLLNDAELLCENGRFASAVGLGVLAIEEAGKEAMLRTLALAESANELNEAWRDYRTHTSKNRLFAVPFLNAHGTMGLEDLKPLFKGSEYPQSIEDLKQRSLYSDCLGGDRWSSPNEAICEEMAKGVIAAARAVIKNKTQVTEKEVELWLQHMAPVKDKDWELKKAALKNWFADLVRLGLLKGNADDYARFVDGKKRWLN